MKKILLAFFFSIITVFGTLFILANTGPELPVFIPAKDSIWTEIYKDVILTEWVKGDECYVLIRQPNSSYKDGVAIRTTAKLTWLNVYMKENQTIQWNFFYNDVLGQEKYLSTFWGKNYTEDTGTEIFANCEKYLLEIPPWIQKDLRKYGAMK
jgi:hypothetical protein